MKKQIPMINEFSRAAGARSEAAHLGCGGINSDCSRSWRLVHLALFLLALATPALRATPVTTALDTKITGESVALTHGTVSTWARLDDAGKVTEVGATLPLSLVETMPPTGSGPARAVAALNFPPVVQQTTYFNHFELHSQLQGHVTGPTFKDTNRYKAPHFDFHFYSIPVAEVLNIPMTFPPLPNVAADRLPAGYGQPDFSLGGMGRHTAPLSEATALGPVEAMMILGFLPDGSYMHFFEPMASRDLLLKRQSFTLPVPQPVNLGRATRYPTEFVVDYNQAADAYHVVFKGFRSTATLPVEHGQTVNGFQDDFTGATRDPNWKVRGTGGDLYVQADGLLRVNTRLGDPNHLLYEAPGYSKTVQEVLARIRITAFGNGQYSRGGIAVGVANNSQGINLSFRNFTEAGFSGRHLRLLDDFSIWGPGLEIDWLTNQWYWLRVRQEPNAGGGAVDVFGKVWVADGQTSEPANWQMAWNYTPTRPLRTGFAGIAGSGGLITPSPGAFEVDYILIKAEGLPSIQVEVPAEAPKPTQPRFTQVTKPASNRLVLEWIGAGILQRADRVTGPWTTVVNVSSPLTITMAGEGQFYRLKD